jgi:hypothetical protein
MGCNLHTNALNVTTWVFLAGADHATFLHPGYNVSFHIISPILSFWLVKHKVFKKSMHSVLDLSESEENYIHKT